jgi:hypothetical protein
MATPDPRKADSDRRSAAAKKVGALSSAKGLYAEAGMAINGKDYPAAINLLAKTAKALERA